MLITCARYVPQIMLDFPLESAAPTKANILKHRLAQLYDYATHPWPALILKITKKKIRINITYARRLLGGWGVFFHLIPCTSRTSAQTRITWCHLNNAGRHVLLPRRTSDYKSGTSRKRNIDLLCRQHRHVTDAQRWSSIAPSSLHLSTQLPARISKQRDFLPLFTLSRTTFTPIPQKAHKNQRETTTPQTWSPATLLREMVLPFRTLAEPTASVPSRAATPRSGWMASWRTRTENLTHSSASFSKFLSLPIGLVPADLAN